MTMMDDRLSELIKKRTEESNKTYGFREDHNPRIPADWWFQNSIDGPVLFIVFYTQACRWAKCLGCNLPSKVSQHHVDYRNIMKQTDFIFHHLLSKRQRQDLKKIILSNNGSVLDEETLSTTALLYFIAQMNLHCHNISVLTIESRAEYVDFPECEVIHRAIQEGESPTELEIAIGFEAFDDTIRNTHFKKGLTLDVFENLVKMLAQYRFRLKIYFMLKPVPGLSEEAAISDITEGIRYLDRISKRFGLQINMHLNPTFVAQGTPLEDAFKAGKYMPPKLESVRRAILAAESTGITLFAGLNDEGLAVPGGSFIREGDEELINLLEEFNRTQDFSLLK
jgi:radical SAM enzyme (TIGR01210 family)